MNALESSPLFDIGSLDDPMSPIHLDNNEIEKFCTPDSLAASSNYVNILLTSYGYSVPLVFNSTEADEKCKIVNCLYSLLQDRKSDANERQDLTSIINNMKKAQIKLESQVVNLKRENQSKEKQYNEIRGKLEANQNIHKKQLIQNTRLKEEISKVKNEMQYMKTQYAHESNRHEQELAKTKDTLVRNMNNQYKTKIASHDTNIHYGATADIAADEDLVVQIRKKYTEILLKANAKEREKKLEIEDLKTYLVNLYTGIRRLLEEQISRFDNDTQMTDTTPRDSYAETVRFRLPENCGGKETIRMVEDLLVRLKEEWNHQIDQKSHEFTKNDMIEKDEVIEELQKTIEELIEVNEQIRDRFEETTGIYKRFENGGFFDTLYPTPNDAYRSDSEDSVTDLENEDQYKYRVLRKKAMRDQHRVTESAIELGYQRSQLEAERWAFQEMKRELQMQEILQEKTPAEPPQSSRKQPASNNIEQPERARKRLKSWLGIAPSNN